MGAPEPDPDALLRALQDGGPAPPLPPLRLADPPPSDRRVAGAAVGATRRAVIRLIAPTLADLLAQLERDRHRQRAELERLAERVAHLEAAAPDGPTAGPA